MFGNQVYVRPYSGKKVTCWDCDSDDRDRRLVKNDVELEIRGDFGLILLCRTCARNREEMTIRHAVSMYLAGLEPI